MKKKIIFYQIILILIRTRLSLILFNLIMPREHTTYGWKREDDRNSDSKGGTEKGQKFSKRIRNGSKISYVNVRGMFEPKFWFR